jgi:chromosome segregation ATPase
MPIGSNTDINQTVLNALVEKANNLTIVKRAEFALATQEAEAAAQEAADEREGYLQIVAGFDWENKADASELEIKTLQQALQDLGHPVNTIDGVITPGRATEQAYNAAQEEVSAMEYTNAQADVEAARERLADANATLRGIQNEPPITEAEFADSIEGVDRRISELTAAKDSLDSGVPQVNLPIEEINALKEQYSASLNQLVDMKERLETALSRLERGITPEFDARAEVGVAGMEVRTAERRLEAMQQNMADEADVYSRLEMSDDPTAQELKDALKKDPEGKKLLSQLEVDLKLLKDEDGNSFYSGDIDGHKGVDYAFGSGVAKGATKALKIHGSLTAIRRAARIAEVTREAEINPITQEQIEAGI